MKDEVTKIVWYPLQVTITESEKRRLIEFARPSKFEIEEQIKKGYSYDTLAAAQDFLYDRVSKLKLRYANAKAFPCKFENTYCSHCSEPIKLGETIRWLRGAGAWHERCWQDE